MLNDGKKHKIWQFVFVLTPGWFIRSRYKLLNEIYLRLARLAAS